MDNVLEWVPANSIIGSALLSAQETGNECSESRALALPYQQLSFLLF